MRGVAAMVLATVLAGIVHLPSAEDQCVPSGPEQHDESKHAFAPVVETTHGHCAICHWQRLQRPGFVALAVETPALLSGVELSGSADARPLRRFFAQLPPRAPPVTA